MFKSLIAIIAGIFLTSVTAFAAPTDLTVTSGTCSLTIDKQDVFGRASKIICLKFTWTSDANGNVVALTQNFHGLVRRIVTDPGATAPTDDYDLSLLDENGSDVLNAKGADRDTANTEQVIFGPAGTPFPLVPFAGPMTFKIAAAGSAKVGVSKIYVEL